MPWLWRSPCSSRARRPSGWQHSMLILRSMHLRKGRNAWAQSRTKQILVVLYDSMTEVHGNIVTCNMVTWTLVHRRSTNLGLYRATVLEGWVSLSPILVTAAGAEMQKCHSYQMLEFLSMQQARKCGVWSTTRCGTNNTIILIIVCQSVIWESQCKYRSRHDSTDSNISNTTNSINSLNSIAIKRVQLIWLK